MHEMALAESVLQICEDHARRAGAERVVRVRLQIGALSHVEPEALAFCFDSVVAGTLAEGASLEIDRVPGRAWCETCGKEVEVGSILDACPECGGFPLRVTDGDQMRVRDMEVV